MKKNKEIKVLAKYRVLYKLTDSKEPFMTDYIQGDINDVEKDAIKAFSRRKDVLLLLHKLAEKKENYIEVRVDMWNEGRKVDKFPIMIGRFDCCGDGFLGITYEITASKCDVI